MSNEPTTVAELLDALLARGAAEEIGPGRGLARAVRLIGRAGVVVGSVRLPGSGDPEALRRAWKRRVGTTNLRLLVIGDGSEAKGLASAKGAILVFGPGGKGPIRALPGRAVLRLLDEAKEKRGIAAARHLADGFARYDRAETPGLAVRGLLTSHALTERFLKSRGKARSREKAASLAARVPRGADWERTLRSLGYGLERLPDRGWVAKAGRKRVAVVLPSAPGTDLAKLDDQGRPREGRLLGLCRDHDVRFGLLASGSRIRLFDSRASAAASTFLELDGGALLADERPLLGLLGPPTLAGGGFDELRRDARRYGVDLWKALGRRIRNLALPALARGLDAWACAEGVNTRDEKQRLELQHASLTLLFRLMFLFYAESAGFLPMGNPIYRRKSLTALAAEARDTQDRLAGGSTALWDTFRTLVQAMRSGNPAWGVPAYNGALFDPAALEGAGTLEKIELADPEFGAILTALGVAEGGKRAPRGVDYSSLEIGHLGNIYESLLGLRLSVADRPMAYDTKRDRYRRTDGDAEVSGGALLWQTHAGGRKAGGVYYTPTSLVRHLVDRSVRPAYREHLARVAHTAERDPEAAAKQLLDFAVVDPACGSGHFLVQVVDVLADEVARFLTRQPLPALSQRMDDLRGSSRRAGAGDESSDGAVGGVEDLSLLRRLLVKHSVFGVDVSAMGAEIAKLSLWLAAFVPGLSLSYLGRNVVVGNSLFGVADPFSVVRPNTFEAKRLQNRIRQASAALAGVADSLDRTPAEYDASRAADAAAGALTAGLQDVFDLWTAEAFGEVGNRHWVTGEGFRLLTGGEELPRGVLRRVRKARALSKQHSFLHWPLEFAGVFAREHPGFDAVVGNPPWEKVKVEKHTFYALYRPGLLSLSSRKRSAEINALLHRRPELGARLKTEQARTLAQRAALKSGGYEGGSGDSDLYRYFCQRYRVLLRTDGRLGVVLPRSAFNAKGSQGFRQWLLRRTTVHRTDFLVNKGRWAFDSEERYSIALLAAQNLPPTPEHTVEIAGVADSVDAWEAQAERTGVPLPGSLVGGGGPWPLLRDTEELALLRKIRVEQPFPLGCGRWTCFAATDVHESNDKQLRTDVPIPGLSGFPLWKGESFDQYDPHGAEERWCPDSGALQKKIRKQRPGSGQLVGKKISLAVKELVQVATDFDIVPLEPGEYGAQLPGRPAGREGGMVAVPAEFLDAVPERGERVCLLAAGVGGAEEEAGGPAIGARMGEVVEADQVEVSGRDGERVPEVKVTSKRVERPRVSVRPEVVHELRTSHQELPLEDRVSASSRSSRRRLRSALR